MKRAFIIASGELPPPGLMLPLVKSADLVICADGGANHARALGIEPDLIIGDFDSILPSTAEFFSKTIQIRQPDQGSTDLEKAVSYCIENSVDRADAAGTLEGRLDHTSGSLGCFKKFGRLIGLRMFDNFGVLTMIRGEVNLKMRPGEKLSLIPVDRCSGIFTENLRYGLHNGVLEPGVSEGISNEAVSGGVKIRVADGTLLLYRFYSPDSPPEAVE